MRRYLISFPSDAMDSIPEEEMSDVDAAAHAVVDEAKDAGVYVFSGGLFDDVVPVLVAADGTVTTATYPRPRTSTGGSPLSRCPRVGQPWSGRRRWRLPAAVLKRSASSGTTHVSDRARGTLA
jgi:hypothetical protein